MVMEKFFSTYKGDLNFRKDKGGNTHDYWEFLTVIRL